MKNKITVLLLFIVVGGIGLLNLMTPDRLFSTRERRKLKQKPEFTLQEFMNKRWQTESETYLLDQFPGRNIWLDGKLICDLVMGKREARNIYIASDGYLIDTFRNFSMEQFQTNIQQLGHFTNTVQQEYELPIHVILVPTATEILKEKLPDYAPTIDQHALTELAVSEGVPIVDVLTELQIHADEQLYYRTDHHYTSLGAWYCYQMWRTARGLPPDHSETWSKEILCDSFYGTTYHKVSLPWIKADSITAWYRHPFHSVVYNDQEQENSIYHRKSLNGQDPYAVFLNSNQALSVIEGSGKSGKLLLIKDSFGNTFAQFPIEEFQQVHAVDLRFWRGNLEQYIRQNGITEVLILYGMENFSLG